MQETASFQLEQRTKLRILKLFAEFNFTQTLRVDRDIVER